jgi:hypothetical protein
VKHSGKWHNGILQEPVIEGGASAGQGDTALYVANPPAFHKGTSLSQRDGQIMPPIHRSFIK